MEDKTITIRDDLGDELLLEQLPRRIVSLVPSVTETVVDLGAGDRLVGITNYCVHPAEAVASLRKVGGTKGFSFEKIDELHPDLILANKEENRRHQIDRLRESYPVFVTYPRTVDDAIKMVIDLGALTGTSAQAREFALSCESVMEAVDGNVTALRTACFIWRDPWMAAGHDTYMNSLLSRLGFANVFEKSEGRYPETTLQSVLERDPEVILLPDEPYEFGQIDREEIGAISRGLVHARCKDFAIYRRSGRGFPAIAKVPGPVKSVA
jgi:ABC-type Fe3+-hydroxamate transport system substrate-binding protein